MNLLWKSLCDCNAFHLPECLLNCFRTWMQLLLVVNSTYCLRSQILGVQNRPDNVGTWRETRRGFTFTPWRTTRPACTTSRLFVLVRFSSKSLKRGHAQWKPRRAQSAQSTSEGRSVLQVWLTCSENGLLFLSKLHAAKKNRIWSVALLLKVS